MLHHTSSQPVKQRTVRESLDQLYRRQKSFSYTLKDANATAHIVCKQFFLSTLGFKPSNDKPLQTALKSYRNSVKASKDYRGKNSSHNKIDDTPIKQHILGFNPDVSHYRREHAPNRLYLPSDLSVKTLHEHFIKNNQDLTCSYEKYRKVVRDLNISFANLGHEECEKCEEFKLHNENHNDESLKDDCACCTEWKKHIDRANESRKQYKQDADLIEHGTVIYSVDLQKVIMLPRMEMFKTAIFVSRLVVYNETFAPVGKKHTDLKIIPVLWH